ncbi:MAG: hypothetical protein NTV56_09490 [Alphaproteobacteria bacterium]|nr:hypothetical protein [Alphaproteobacteria bacterium]
MILSEVHISGSTVYKPHDFDPAYAGLVGTRITLKEVYAIAQRITATYGRDGYVLSRAIVPPQQLNERAGSIQIQIVEGYIDRVEWPREKLSRYIDFFSTYEAKILADRPINSRTLERYLLLANDLPGLRFTTSLKPSPNTPNASTLVVDVTAKPIDLEARIDNRGTEARGPIQFWSSANVSNLLGAHEQITFTWAGTEQLKELQYYAVSAKKVINA